MNIIFNTSKIANKATDGMYSVVEERFSTLKKFLKEDEPVKITVESKKKNIIKVKAQIVLNDNCRLRAEERGDDFYVVINEVKENLKEQAIRHKEKHSRKEKTSKARHEKVAIEPLKIEEDVLPKIVKVKRFYLESITQTMAINEMEKLGHEQFVFKNIEADDKICMIYKRFDGDYAMIIVEG